MPSKYTETHRLALLSTLLRETSFHTSLLSAQCFGTAKGLRMTVEHWVLREHFYQLREDSGNTLGWKSARAEGSGLGCCETLSSNQDVATVLANSQPQPLWSPTQEQVSQHSSMDSEGLMRPHPLLSWQLGCWRRGRHFSSAM